MFCWVNTFAYLCGMKKVLFANKEMAQQEGGWLKIGHIKTETMEFYSTCPSVTFQMTTVFKSDAKVGKIIK